MDLAPHDERTSDREEQEEEDDGVVLDIEGIARGHLLDSATVFLTTNESSERNRRRSARRTLRQGGSDPLPYPQPAHAVRSSLVLEFCGSTELEVPELPAFRNNIAVYSDMYDYLVVAERHRLLLFVSNPVTRLVNPRPQLMVDTRPPYTTPEMRAGANWPMEPHGINSLNVFKVGEVEVLVACCDNGRVVLWKTEYLLKQMENHPEGPIEPECLSFQLKRSAWGADIDGDRKLLAVSNNSHRVTVFFLGDYFSTGQRDEALEPMESPRLDHNIPDVKFVNIPDCAPETFYLSCISISGQVALWEFYYGERLKLHRQHLARGGTTAPDEPQSGLDIDEYDDTTVAGTSGFQDISGKTFPYGKWVYRESFQQEGWTINIANAWDFKEVDSIFEATANKWISEDALFKYIRSENKKVLKPYLASPNKPTSVQDVSGTEDLHPFIRFVFHEIETQFVQNRNHWSVVSQESAFSLPICQRRDQIRNKALTDKSEPELLNPPFKDIFYLCTTKKSLYLCRAENMACNGACSNVFNWDSPYGSDEVYFDRLNVVKVIPSLSLMIVASQVGAVSLFRLTRYKGFFFMRQEYVFPNVEKYLFEGPRLRILVGLAVGPVKSGETGPLLYGYQQFKLQLIYLDGFVMTYEISTTDNDISVDNYVM